MPPGPISFSDGADKVLSAPPGGAAAGEPCPAANPLVPGVCGCRQARRPARPAPGRGPRPYPPGMHFVSNGIINPVPVPLVDSPMRAAPANPAARGQAAGVPAGHGRHGPARGGPRPARRASAARPARAAPFPASRRTARCPLRDLPARPAPRAQRRGRHGCRRRRVTTVALQQEASRRLGFSIGETMETAQRLYEGVYLGGDPLHWGPASSSRSMDR